MKVETHSHHTNKNNSARTGDSFYSDGALSAGLELTDAQADYSAFLGHMTRDLHASPLQCSMSSRKVIGRQTGGL